MKRKSSFMITPEEVIANALYKRQAESDPNGILIRDALYQAGVVDGVRRERARRATKPSPMPDISQDNKAAYRNGTFTKLLEIEDEQLLRTIFLFAHHLTTAD